ncbi:hypothetical protein [Jeongeupia chitinilytica]|uniref:hypothetical protein n=1 Tax=Jeongeupia chitinilytica TaxID=1041641 RepID=UPI001679A53B|nr:hypothetical protein [Jeongeupia chitinilytica]
MAASPALRSRTICPRRFSQISNHVGRTPSSTIQTIALAMLPLAAANITTT